MPLDKVKISNCAIALVAKVLTLAATGQPLAASVILGAFPWLLYPLRAFAKRFHS
jgi:hypothetical protein